MLWTIIGFVLLGALLVIDIYLATDSVRGNTWSELLRTWGKYTPFVPWVWAVLLGHWFNPGNKAVFGQPTSVVILVWMTYILVISGLVLFKVQYPIPPWTVILPGIVAGMLLWPVK